MNRRTGGRTLVELLIACSILLLLTTACAAALRASVQYQKRIQEQGLMENELLVSLGLLSKELSESSPDAVDWSSAPPALTFPTPRSRGGSLLIDHSAGNQLRFQTVVSYRVEGADNDLRRYVDVLATPEPAPPHPLHMVPPRDTAYFTSPGREFRRLATGVVNFAVEAVNIDDYNEAQTVVSNFAEAEMIRIDLRLERDLSHNFAISTRLEVVPAN